MSIATHFSFLPATFPITRRDDGSTLLTSKELHYDEELKNCTCFLLSNDKTQLGGINFSIEEKGLTINFINSLAKQTYYGIGTQLMKIAVKCAEVYANRRVFVYSTGDSVGFYHKMGFTVDWMQYERRVPLPPEKRAFMEREFKRIVSGDCKNSYCFFMVRV